MIVITDEAGTACITLDLIPLDGSAWAIPVKWHPDAEGLPHPQELGRVLSSILDRARGQGARFVECRVLRDAGRAAERERQANRADLLGAVLRQLGFGQGEGRVELRLPLDQALAALAEEPDTPDLVWQCVDTTDEAALERAARLLQQAASGDPGAHEEDDALGFLLAFRDEHGGALPHECLQLAYHKGTPAALLALALDGASGWCSIHYLAVAPEKRGLGIGRRAFRHGLACLARLGGREYHDGTGEHNLAARALLRRLGDVPLQHLEEWRIGL